MPIIFDKKALHEGNYYAQVPHVWLVNKLILLSICAHAMAVIAFQK